LPPAVSGCAPLSRRGLLPTLVDRLLSHGGAPPPTSLVSVIRSLVANEGVYEARRASALAGVPISTVYDWARKGVVVPSVSPVREKLWSYADLMALRIVSWLRHPKNAPEGPLPASPMPEVRRALRRLDELDLDPWTDSSSSPLRVDRSGRIYVVAASGAVETIDGQSLLGDWLDLLGPFEYGAARGPDLRRPAPHLRIVPGKCSGEPHLAGTRITTLAVAALAERGYDLEVIARLYPSEDRAALAEAIALEQLLAGGDNLAA
jgi:uncharacterized protein (DUF433 family)